MMVVRARACACAAVAVYFHILCTHSNSRRSTRLLVSLHSLWIHLFRSCRASDILDDISNGTIAPSSAHLSGFRCIFWILSNFILRQVETDSHQTLWRMAGERLLARIFGPTATLNLNWQMCSDLCVSISVCAGRAESVRNDPMDGWQYIDIQIILWWNMWHRDAFVSVNLESVLFQITNFILWRTFVRVASHCRRGAGCWTPLMYHSFVEQFIHPTIDSWIEFRRVEQQQRKA